MDPSLVRDYPSKCWVGGVLSRCRVTVYLDRRDGDRGEGTECRRKSSTARLSIVTFSSDPTPSTTNRPLLQGVFLSFPLCLPSWTQVPLGKIDQ